MGTGESSNRSIDQPIDQAIDPSIGCWHHCLLLTGTHPIHPHPHHPNSPARLALPHAPAHRPPLGLACGSCCICPCLGCCRRGRHLWIAAARASINRSRIESNRIDDEILLLDRGLDGWIADDDRIVSAPLPCLLPACCISRDGHEDRLQE